MKTLRNRPVVLYAAFFAAFALCVCLPACKAKDTGLLRSQSQIRGAMDELRVADLKPVLGEARDDASGVVECSSTEDALVISYRYYDADLLNIDNDMVTEMAPKIQALYKKFHALDRIRFQVAINSTTPGKWEPYASFLITRTIVDEMQWSGILFEDFLKRVLEFHRLG